MRNCRAQSAVEIFRVLLSGARPRTLAPLVEHGLEYAKCFIHAQHSRRRFGFSRPFSEVAIDAVHFAIARLLPELEESPDQAVRIPLVAQGRKILERNCGGTIDAWTDKDLDLVLRRIVRYAASQSLVRLWLEEHPLESRILRSLKRRLRSDRRILLRRDARGHWLGSRRSNWSLPPIPASRLATALGGSSLASRSILDALRPLLVPDAGHGGTCYLLDVVRTVARRRIDLLVSEPTQTGAVPAGMADWTTHDGVPWEILRERLLRGIEGHARTIVRADLEKERRRGCASASRDARELGPEVVEAWVKVCVALVSRPLGIGDGTTAPQSQHQMLGDLLGSVYTGDPFFHRDKTNYIVRRIRRRWAAATG